MTNNEKDQIRQMLDDDCSLQELTQKLMELQSGRQYLVIEDGEVIQCTVPAGDITIPDGVARIDDGAFRSCIRLTGVTIPESVVEIGQYAFADCHGLTDVAIPKNVARIGQNAFRNCRNLSSVTIPESVTEIGAGAFANCRKLAIHAPAGSYAERYAKKNCIRFETAN